MNISISIGPRPHLDAELIDYLATLFVEPKVYLEYGCGSSSVFFLEGNTGNVVYSVDTDKNYLGAVAASVSAKGHASRFFPFYADIGPTRSWGYPSFEKDSLDISRAQKFIAASLAPWQALKRNGHSPAVCLIDGRFRLGSFLACCLLADSPTEIIFDDYLNRSRYHKVEAIAQPHMYLGRSVVFSIKPSEIDKNRILTSFLPWLLLEG